MTDLHTISTSNYTSQILVRGIYVTWGMKHWLDENNIEHNFAGVRTWFFIKFQSREDEIAFKLKFIYK